jgi:hypothetical protein
MRKGGERLEVLRVTQPKAKFRGGKQHPRSCSRIKLRKGNFSLLFYILRKRGLTPLQGFKADSFSVLRARRDLKHQDKKH